jgi:hypothetical protein
MDVYQLHDALLYIFSLSCLLACLRYKITTTTAKEEEENFRNSLVCLLLLALQINAI